MIRETLFTSFWRAHNARLAALGQPAATNGEAVQAFKVWELYAPPCHQRNTGKNL